MDKYHIYEEIGKGEYSQVFKGREKRKIEYVAIKRVDKGNMAKTVNEVQIMHKLQNPHILRFHDWYETKNNLWLILEYCTGADLHSLLSQDHHLPEASIKIFAIDILSGLKYLHSTGILHCDIRPKNFLIDEHGIVKFANFKYARKIPKAVLGNEPIENRGFPQYMAPELFNNNAVHSYFSDFWSFGCILYVFRRGLESLPWSAPQDEPLESMISKIHSSDIFSSPWTKDGGPPLTSMSAELVDLISWLVEKSPCDRCYWDELVSHPFWNGTIITAPTSLQVNVHYDGFVRDIMRQRVEQIESEVLKDREVKVVASNMPTYPRDESTPSGPSPSRSNIRSLLSSSSRRSSSDKKPSSPSGADLSLGGLNDDRSHENEFPQSRNYHGRFAHNVNIEKVLNQTKYSAIDMVQCDTLIIHSSDLQVKPIIGNRQIEVLEKPQFKSNLSFATISTSDTSNMNQHDLENHLTIVYKAAYKLMTSIFQITNTSNVVLNSTTTSALSSILNLLAYLHTLSTSPEVSNIVLNTSFLNLLLRLLRANVSLTSSSSAQSRRYGNLNSPSGKSTQTNSSSSHLLLSMKIMIVTILGSMLRYATFILPPSGRKDEHVVPLLLSLLESESDVKLKRRLVAALGELVFYITAQDDSQGTNKNSNEGWDLPPIHDVFLRCLQDDDEIIKHYSAKTIENIISQGNHEFRDQLLTVEMGQTLLRICEKSTSDQLQTTTAMAVSLMFHRVDEMNLSSSKKFISFVMQKTDLNILVDMLGDGQPRLQQAILNIVNMSFKDSAVGFRSSIDRDDSLMSKSRETFINHPALMSVLCRLLEMSNMITLRAKSILCINLLCRYSPNLIIKLGGTRFTSTLCRLIESSSGTSLSPNVPDNISASYMMDVAIATVSFLQFTALKIVNSIADIRSIFKEFDPEQAKSPEKSGIQDNLDINGRKGVLKGKNSEIAFRELSDLCDQSQILSSIVTIVSQGALRRLFFSAKIIPFIVSFVQALSELEHFKDATSARLLEFIGPIEHSLMLCLETIAKIDFEERLVSITVTGEDVNAEIELVSVLISFLLPEIISCTSNSDPDARVVIVSCIRNLFPSLVKASAVILERFPSAPFTATSTESMIENFFRVVPVLLKDFQPIPQYVTKLLFDLMDMDYGQVELLSHFRKFVRNLVRGLPVEFSDILASHTSS